VTEILLPFPPSVNDMYIRGRVLSGDYRAWRLEAGHKLNRQNVPTFQGRCQIHIDLDDTRKGDCDNRAKPILDLLVTQGVLLGDSKKHVKRVSIGWEKLTGCRVAITEEA
jgi:Holliday junction resolvase RusA-like endonuclease